MLAYTVRRILAGVVTSFVVVTIIFFSMRILPGDPAIAILGEYASQESIEALRKSLGLNKPLWHQYVDFWSDLAHGDLGHSFANYKSVTSLIANALPYTLIVLVEGEIIALLIGVPIGVIAAVKRNTLIDHIARVSLLLGLSLPTFYLAMILLYVFSLKLHLFPIRGGGDISNISDFLYRSFLPSLTLGSVQAAFIGRVTRSSMLETLYQDYIRTARSKGLSEKAVIYKHALRNALLNIVTVIGLLTGILIAAGVITDMIFSRPGVGRLLIGAILHRDYLVVQSLLMVIAVLIVLINLFTDLIYSYIDPRIKL